MPSEEFGGLRKTLNVFLDLFLVWFASATHPVKACEKLLAISSGMLRESMKLWTISFLLALVVDLPLYHPFGFRPKEH